MNQITHAEIDITLLGALFNLVSHFAKRMEIRNSNEEEYSRSLSTIHIPHASLFHCTAKC